MLKKRITVMEPRKLINNGLFSFFGNQDAVDLGHKDG